MNEYGLYLESGPKRRKTMVHVFDLLGCVANGPTTEEALEATPAVISAYLRFLQRIGEAVEPGARFTTRVVEHVTEGEWLGNGSPYAFFAPDLEPVSVEELETFLHRLNGLTAALAGWAESQIDAGLDAIPGDGRTARAILLHALGSTGSYVATALPGTTGFSRLVTAAERGEIAIADALRQVEALARDRLLRATPAQRSAVIERPKEVRTLRKAVRRILEHYWEHLAELARRAGGPEL